MRTVEYAPGRRADVFVHAARPTILLWHGMQTDARAAVRPLAGLLAGHGAAVVVPDWNSHAHDGGRADLLGSLEYTRQRADGADIVLVGWSLGGAAAAALTLDAAHFNVILAHTVCLAGAFTAPDPISGRLVTDRLSADHIGTPFTLLHGLADDVVPVRVSRDFAVSLERIGWPVELVELAADHGSIAGAVYDPVADRYEPATGGAPLSVATEVAARVASIISAAAPTEAATKHYNEDMKAAMPQTVWVTGCSSWYLGKDGLPELFPWTPQTHRELLRQPRLADFDVRTA
ncbi:esterase [Mycobacterium kansasii]|nr:esterase [Mycobacterium kansasii]